MDDVLARRTAAALSPRLTGPPRLLVKARTSGVIPAVAPALHQLDALRFRLAPRTRAAVLSRAGAA
ncbi:MAG: DUF3368 domain-containing protein [Candidatus Latescibacterota bacterium]